MTAESRLFVRLFVGARGRDLARYASVLLAATLVGWALSLGVCVALLGQHEAVAQAARAPVRSESTTGLWLAESAAMLDGRPWTRIVVSASLVGTPPPPGMATWPVPGTSVVSPALAELLAEPRNAGIAGPVDPGMVLTQDGLANPSELYSWTVLEPGTPLGTAYREISGFARLPRNVGEDGLFTTLAAVVLVLGLPAVLSFRASYSFLLASRTHRFRTLLRIGLPRDRWRGCSRQSARPSPSPVCPWV